MMVQTYLRRGKRNLERMALDPKLRRAGTVIAYSGSGFLLSAAALGNAPQPLAMGLICAGTGWRTLAMSLGAMVGYPTFWGRAGTQGILWSAAGGLLALLVGKKEESREQPLMIPAITAFLAAVSGISYHFFVEETSLVLTALRTAIAFFSAVLFSQFARCRDTVTDWLVGGIGVLALSRVGLGFLAAGALSLGAPFPAAALAGLAIDLTRITPLPMTAVMCLSYFIGMIPFHKKWQHFAAPVFACTAIMAACGIWDTAPLPGLALGGALGALLPARPALPRRRGETGVAQVRLEVGASLFGTLETLLMEADPPPIDENALLDRVKKSACAGCAARVGCTQRDMLTPELLDRPLEADCKKQGRLVPELRRAGEHRKLLGADRRRRQEYQRALARQYRFLGSYLRSLADKLPRSAGVQTVAFRIEVSARTRGKEVCSGDRCLAFSGPECRYYVVLCDGMGTGAGAALEGQTAGNLLKTMLTAGFPAAEALDTLNSLLVLRGTAGAVTVDLAELHLDTGHAHLYKWGAAPSLVLTRAGAEKIGTATPPPGISIEESWQAKKLSLRRGEVLMLLSDGLDGEGVLGLSDLSPDLPPGELAAKLLESGCGKDDDATAAVIKLRPNSLATS